MQRWLAPAVSVAARTLGVFLPFFIALAREKRAGIGRFVTGAERGDVRRLAARYLADDAQLFIA